MQSYQPMGRKNKKRQCPALNKEIDSADCGTNRHSQYDCPANCIYSPYHPDNYDQALEVEDQLDELIRERASRHPYFGPQLGRLYSQPEGNEFTFAGKLMKLLHFDRDDNGKTLFEDWEEDGFAKLKNDTRVLLSHKRSMRVSLIEMREVVDKQTVTFVDLLQEENKPHTAIDRGMTSRACRFVTMLAYYYCVPGYTRFHASAQELPRFTNYSGLEAFLAIIKHLDGDTSQEWLLTNLELVWDALEATHKAQNRKQLLLSNFRSQELTYQLNIPAARAASLLRASALTENPPDEESCQDGFTYTFDYQMKSVDSPGAATRVLGTVKLKEGQARLFSINSEGMPPIRETFEGALGKNAEFQQELVEDFSRQIAETMPETDASLVPPEFLKFDTGLSIETESRNSPPGFQPGAADKAQYLDNYYRNLLDQPIPALDNSTPRQASEDFILRPKLVTWVKELIRTTDRTNLFLGETVNLDWIFDELGLDDIRVPPPPPRPVPESSREAYDDLEDYDDPSDYDDDYPDDDFEDTVDDFLLKAYIKLIGQFLAEMKSRDEGLIRMKASGCNFMDILHAELDEDMSPKVRTLLDIFAPAIWYALGLEGKFLQVDSDSLVDEFDLVLMDLENLMTEGMLTTRHMLADLCSDVDLFMAVSQLAEVYLEQTSNPDKLTDAETSDLMFHLIVISNVLSMVEMEM